MTISEKRDGNGHLVNPDGSIKHDPLCSHCYETSEKWERDFEDRWYDSSDHDGEKTVPGYDDLVAFVRSLLQTQETELRERWAVEVEGMTPYGHPTDVLSVGIGIPQDPLISKKSVLTLLRGDKNE